MNPFWGVWFRGIALGTLLGANASDFWLGIAVIAVLCFLVIDGRSLYDGLNK